MSHANVNTLWNRLTAVLQAGLAATIGLSAVACDSPEIAPPAISQGGESDESEMLIESGGDNPLLQIQSPQPQSWVESPQTYLDADTEPFAFGGINIRSIEINQGVAVELYNNEGGWMAPSQRASTVIAGRGAALRAYWELPESWHGRLILAKLHIVQSHGTTVVEDIVRVDNPSGPEQLTRTFSWVLEESDVTADMHTFVTLHEVEFTDLNEASVDEANPPIVPSLAMPLYADPTPAELSIVIVPVKFSSKNCKSNTAEPLSDSSITDKMKELLFVRHPIQSLDFSVREEAVEFSGSTWAELIDLVRQARREDNASDWTHYYAMLDACGESLEGYGGYSLIPSDSPAESSRRIGSGLWSPRSGGTNNEFSLITMVHEIGHTLGRRHTPCGNAAGVDSDYPHEDGRIGTWGFDIVTAELKNPNEVHDHMSYCYYPSWTSDYGWNNVYDRVRTLSDWKHNPTSHVGSTGPTQHAELTLAGLPKEETHCPAPAHTH